MQASPKALPALLPIGLGAEGGNFNTIFRDTFTRVVICLLYTSDAADEL